MNPLITRSLVTRSLVTRSLVTRRLVTPVLDPDRVERCRGTAAAAGFWSAPPPRGTGAPSPARSTS